MRNLPLRRLLGVLTLFGLHLGLAGSLVAAMCGPCDDVGHAGGHEGHRSEVVLDMDEASKDPCAGPFGPSSGERSGSHCPLTAAPGNGCAAASSLPATPAEGVGPAPEDLSLPAESLEAVASLNLPPPFQPPRG